MQATTTSSLIFRPGFRGLSALALAAFVIAALAAAPIASVWANLFAGGTGDTWSHLAATVLPEYIANTLWLCLGVGSGVILVGVSTAWLVTMHDFPGRRVFEWALVLPLAVPAYVMAYTYTDLLQFVGPVQSGLRENFGWQKGDYWFPDVRTLGGAIAMFIFVLYPYVYLLARTAFLERASGMLEVGRSLGLGAWGSFFRVSLPLARPAVAAGTALALMETLADYGTVAYFAVQTFTTGIYRAWFSSGRSGRCRAAFCRAALFRRAGAAARACQSRAGAFSQYNRTQQAAVWTPSFGVSGRSARRWPALCHCCWGFSYRQVSS